MRAPHPSRTHRRPARSCPPRAPAASPAVPAAKSGATSASPSALRSPADPGSLALPARCLCLAAPHARRAPRPSLPRRSLPSPWSSSSVRSRRDPPNRSKPGCVTFAGSHGMWTKQGLWFPPRAHLPPSPGSPCCPSTPRPSPLGAFAWQRCPPLSPHHRAGGVPQPPHPPSLPFTLPGVRAPVLVGLQTASFTCSLRGNHRALLLRRPPQG